MATAVTRVEVVLLRRIPADAILTLHIAVSRCESSGTGSKDYPRSDADAEVQILAAQVLRAGQRVTCGQFARIVVENLKHAGQE